MTPAPESALPRPPALGVWSRGQALAMAAALSAGAWWHAAWPIGVLALPSFLGLFALGRGAFTPNGRFGMANAVTAFRLLLVLALSAPAPWLETSRVLAIVSTVLALDLLDGWLARRHGDASAFGAHFDMETDALLVLLVTVRLYLVHGLAAWVLFAGGLRYLYVLWLWFWPGTGREAPRSRWGRFAFVGLMVGLCAGLALPGAPGKVAVCLGTLLVTASFARSCYYSRRAS